MGFRSLLFVVACFAVAGVGAFVPSWLLEGNHLTSEQKQKLSRRTACDIDTCIGPLQNLQHPTTGLKLESLDDADALNLICGQLSQVESCVRTTMASCDGQDETMNRILADTVTGVTTYMCSDEGKNALLTETACWENDQVESKIQQCADDVQTQAYMGMADPCDLMSGFVDCSVSEVRSLCNQKSARFIGKLLYYSMEPTVRELLDGCTFTAPSARDLMKVLKGF